MATVERYRQSYEDLAHKSAGPAWLNELRTVGLERFVHEGFPTKKREAWRYTDVSAVEETPFVPAERARAEVREQDLAGLRLEGAATELVFVNGRLSDELSRMGALPKGAFAGALSVALEERGELVSSHLGKIAPSEGAPFAALNTAFVEEGAFVFVPKGKAVAGPIHLVFVGKAEGDDVETHPRNLIVLAEGAEATVVETWISSGQRRAFANVVSEVVVSENASLEHHLWQRHGAGTFHIGCLAVRQERDSRYQSHAYWLGGALSRNDLTVALEGPGAECRLHGLYVASSAQHIDNHTLIDHKAPHCTSAELYKGVLDERGHGVFNGIVYVRPGASKSDAQQANHNLLLSEDASVDTKPQLEIFNDDVKCSHGSTVGQLDDEALFYLRSRGVARAEAERMLTTAFASAVVEAIADEGLRERVYAFVNERLAELPGGRA